MVRFYNLQVMKIKMVNVIIQTQARETVPDVFLSDGADPVETVCQ